MSLNVKKVWLKREDQEILVKSSEVQPGDEIIVHMGNVIPFDGEVSDGEGMVNQASLTGEAMPVRRVSGQSVYAGTVLEEGELQIRVKAVTGSTRYEKIVSMIEDSEKLKSSVEEKQNIWPTDLYRIHYLVQGGVAAYKKCNPDIVCSDGRLLLCFEAGNANYGTVCNP